MGSGYNIKCVRLSIAATITFLKLYKHNIINIFYTNILTEHIKISCNKHKPWIY